MRRLYQAFQSQIQYLIIVPYLALMVIVMLVGSGIAITLVADTWQERFNNQLGQVARNFTESFARREIENINYLGLIAFTEANQAGQTPQIAYAMQQRDREGLDRALRSLWIVGLNNENVHQDRLIIFDPAGVTLLDWERQREGGSEPNRYSGTSVAELPLVQMVLRGEQQPIGTTERMGDKYSGLFAFRDRSGNETTYFFTVAPVYLRMNEGEGEPELVGGILVAQQLENLLQFLQNKSQAAISAIYDVDGMARGTTITGVTLADLNLSRVLINQVAALNTPGMDGAGGNSERVGAADDPCLDIGNLTGRLVSPLEATKLPTCSVNTTQTLGDREYQIVYAPLLIRGVQSGYFAVGLSRDFVVSAWSSSRWAVLSVTTILAISAVFLGYAVARRITRPLGDLVDTATAVTSGDLERRSAVEDVNELGQLSSAFNQMTEHLLHLYLQVQQDAKERQAILTSISDGVVVCDRHDQIVLLNQTAEEILGLKDWQEQHIRFDALPLEALPQQREMFGTRNDDQFRLGDRYITLSRAAVVAEDGQSLGRVIVLHDNTEAVLMDQAKTDFIATISHELRTPLTVIRGYTDLLLRGRGNETPTRDQAELLAQVRERAVDMTTIVNNAIMIADLESGQLETDLEPQDVELVLNLALGPFRYGFEQKNLSINLEVATDAPRVLADREQLRRAFGQILDNALRYTEHGGVTIQVVVENQDEVAIRFCDTGTGIPAEMLPRLFKRFQRIEGNSSAQRGSGLGLAITRQLIERQGGQVTVSSTPGAGSTFTITLRQAHEQAIAVAQPKGFATAS